MIKKQNNPAFFSLSHHHALTDLELIVNDKITYAALILLGKKDKIKELLPQCKVVIEYRRSETKIQSDKLTSLLRIKFWIQKVQDEVLSIF